MEYIIYMSLAVASIAFTISETKLFEPVRKWFDKKSKFIYSLLSCGYCLGYWLSFILTAIYNPKIFNLYWPIDYFLTAIVIAWLAGFQWILMCWLMKKSGK